MKILDLEQGTQEWLLARLGIPTASNFDKLLTATGKPSTQAEGYANKLIAEWLTGAPLDEYKSDWMQRGNDLEPQARAYYEMQKDADVQRVGFVLLDSGIAGCSPDGLIGNDGMLEIKCPAPHTHVGYLLTGKMPSDYRQQVQGQLWIAEREWVDFLSFHPLMQPVLVRVHRDEEYIKALSVAVHDLAESLEKRKAALIARGITPLQEGSK